MPDLDLSSPRYELKELAARAGVTARTVHFYIQQGLLPPAGQSGPGARYSEAHLARLLLIRRLQKEHLPLAEIRQRLGALDDQAVVRLAETTRPKPQTAGGHTSALDYIRSVLGAGPPAAGEKHADASLIEPRGARPLSGSASRHVRGFWDRQSNASVSPNAPEPTAPVRDDAAAWEAPPTAAASSDTASLIAHLVRPRTPASAAPASSVPGERSQWERIALAPDIELHIRRPLTRDQNKRVERLVQAARDILEGEV